MITNFGPGKGGDDDSKITFGIARQSLLLVLHLKYDDP